MENSILEPSGDPRTAEPTEVSPPAADPASPGQPSRSRFQRALRMALGLLVGLLSAFFVVMALALLFADVEAEQPPSAGLLLLAFVASWALSSWVVLRGAPKISRVLARSLLLAAAEWLALIPVGVAFGGKMVPQTLSEGGLEGYWMALQTAGCVSVLTGGVAIAMTVVCLLGYTVVTLIGWEMKK